MVLQTQSPASHNQMLGERIRHPPSTNFDDDFKSPAAKRLKRFDSTDSSYSRNVSDDDPDRLDTRQLPQEIPDSEAETEDEEEPLLLNPRQTDLESALPPVKTDEDAIAEYEAFRAAQEEVPLDAQGRLSQRKWIKGKSSIYVDAFNLALDTVLEDEAHLFDEAEIEVFEQWSQLSYEAQYLYALHQAIGSQRSD